MAATQFLQQHRQELEDEITRHEVGGFHQVFNTAPGYLDVVLETFHTWVNTNSIFGVGNGFSIDAHVLGRMDIRADAAAARFRYWEVNDQTTKPSAERFIELNDDRMFLIKRGELMKPGINDPWTLASNPLSAQQYRDIRMAKPKQGWYSEVLLIKAKLTSSAQVQERLEQAFGTLRPQMLPAQQDQLWEKIQGLNQGEELRVIRWKMHPFGWTLAGERVTAAVNGSEHVLDWIVARPPSVAQLAEEMQAQRERADEEEMTRLQEQMLAEAQQTIRSREEALRAQQREAMLQTRVAKLTREYMQNVGVVVMDLWVFVSIGASILGLVLKSFTFLHTPDWLSITLIGIALVSSVIKAVKELCGRKWCDFLKSPRHVAGAAVDNDSHRIPLNTPYDLLTDVD
jgi:hypothetical protein